MNRKLQTLQYHPTVEVRMVMQDNEPWWVLVDVCKVLDIKNPTDVWKRLDVDERARFNLGRQGEAIIINEFGLYSVILRSDKPEAKAFKRWITHEVLPSIRRTGTYSAKGTHLTNHPLPSLPVNIEPLPVSTTAQLLLRILRDLEQSIPYANGEVQIGNRRLGQIMGITSKCTLIKARKELVDAGYIEFTPGVKNYPSIYRLKAAKQTN